MMTERLKRYGLTEINNQGNKTDRRRAENSACDPFCSVHRYMAGYRCRKAGKLTMTRMFLKKQLNGSCPF